MTPEQKKSIKNERKSLKESREIAAEKKELKNEKVSLGKPKKPTNAYILFVMPKCKENNLKPKDLKDEWRQMNDGQKQIYKQQAQALRDVYE